MLCPAAWVATAADVSVADAWFARMEHESVKSMRVGSGRAVQLRDALTHYRLYRAGRESINDFPYIAALVSSGVALPPELISDLQAAGADVNKKLLHGATALHIAAAEGKAELCARLVAVGADMQAQDDDGYTPLDVARDQLLLPAWRALLQAGANPGEDSPPMEQVLVRGDVQALVKLLSDGADANAPINGRPPLLLAALAGDADMCRALLKAGARVDDGEMKTPTIELHVSADGRFDEQELIGRSVQVMRHIESVFTPLHAAAVCGHTEVGQVLLAAGARIDVPELNGRTPLHCAVREGRAEMVRLLLEAGADARAEDSEGNSMLLLAVNEGHAEVCRVLLQAGVRPNRQSDADDPPLLIAAALGHVEVCQVLLEAGANPNVLFGGATPLLIAAAEDHAAVCELLLAAGADVCASGPDGGTALDWALLFGRKTLAEKLLAAGADTSHWLPLHLAAALGHTDEVKRLLASGADAQAASPLAGMSPLYMAVFSGRVEPCQILLAAGGDVNAAQDLGYTPLHAAVSCGHLEVVKLLLAAGADVSARTRFLCTPLCLAAEHGHYEIAELLLAAGAAKNVRDENGETPADVAARVGYTALAELLRPDSN